MRRPNVEYDALSVKYRLFSARHLRISLVLSAVIIHGVNMGVLKLHSLLCFITSMERSSHTISL